MVFWVVVVVFFWVVVVVFLPLVVVIICKSCIVLTKWTHQKFPHEHHPKSGCVTDTMSGKYFWKSIDAANVTKGLLRNLSDIKDA